MHDIHNKTRQFMFLLLQCKTTYSRNKSNYDGHYEHSFKIKGNTDNLIIVKVHEMQFK